MKKIFIVTGELSGDRLAAWYVRKLKQQKPHYIEAVGGNFLAAEGVVLYERFEKLNVAGIVEIIKHVPRLWLIMRSLCAYIQQQSFDEVVVVDFPGFNIQLIKRLKRLCSHIKITYVSPPQMWCWGAWRITSLKKYTDRVVVLYPFEVAWYRQRNLAVEWIGTPVGDVLAPYHTIAQNKKPMIALIPGSRIFEISEMLPLFLKAAQKLLQQHPEISFIFPKASSISDAFINNLVRQHGLEDIWSQIKVLYDEDEKFTLLAQCCVALCKPGTSTLELGFLTVPTIVAFKTSWLTYYIGKMVVSISFMSLPNLFLNKPVFKEVIQYDCTPERLFKETLMLYEAFINNSLLYQAIIKDLSQISHLIQQ